MSGHLELYLSSCIQGDLTIFSAYHFVGLLKCFSMYFLRFSRQKIRLPKRQLFKIKNITLQYLSLNNLGKEECLVRKIDERKNNT